jgi:DNA-binding CsgD family transcriptional regulator
VEPTDEPRTRRIWLILAGLFGLVLALAGFDVVVDLREGATVRHVLTESAMAAVGLVGAAWTVARFRRLARDTQSLRTEAAELAHHLALSRAEAERWRSEAGDLIRGLSAAIDEQLERWGLTKAEQEVALLLLKGMSHKEVASARGVGENTVRHQARAIYGKAGLTGRADLAAFFLEDLLGPRPP